MAKVRDWQTLTTDEGQDVETFERIPRMSTRRWDDETPTNEGWVK